MAIETPKIRVLCVDDHPLVRDGIAFALQMQKDMELVGEATNGEEAITEYRRLRPDVRQGQGRRSATNRRHRRAAPRHF